MRWFWIDRYTEFVSGQCATAVKNVSLAEEHLLDHFDGYPVVPNSLVIEGIAQTAGLLVSEINDFKELVVFAKLTKSRFHFHNVPGDTLTYRVKIEQASESGATVTATSHQGDRLQGEAELLFAHLDEGSKGRQLFDPYEFLTWLKVLRVFEVGRHRDGSKLHVPPNLAQHELTTNLLDQAGEVASE